MNLIILLSAALSIMTASVGNKNAPSYWAEKKAKFVVGYIQDPSDQPAAIGRIPFKKITHLNVAFANPVDTDGNLSVPSNLAEIVTLAHENRVKVCISIGGGFASEHEQLRTRYFELISRTNRSAFVRRIVEYVDRYRLDGLDVDLEGPAINQDYASFVSDLSARLMPKGKLLTAALPGWMEGNLITKESLDHFDLINVMAYDATGPWNPAKPGPHSSFDFAKSGIAFWVGRGVPKAKLVLGVPFYGWGFGDAFNQGGYTFAQLVAKYPGSELTDKVGSTIWYNGIPTIRAKAKYAADQGLAGIMIWSIDQDATGKLSLLSAIQDSLNGK